MILDRKTIFKFSWKNTFRSYNIVLDLVNIILLFLPLGFAAVGVEKRSSLETTIGIIFIVFFFCLGFFIIEYLIVNIPYFIDLVNKNISLETMLSSQVLYSYNHNINAIYINKNNKPLKLQISTPSRYFLDRAVENLVDEKITIYYLEYSKVVVWVSREKQENLDIVDKSRMIDCLKHFKLAIYKWKYLPFSILGCGFSFVFLNEMKVLPYEGVNILISIGIGLFPLIFVYKYFYIMSKEQTKLLIATELCFPPRLLKREGKIVYYSAESKTKNIVFQVHSQNKVLLDKIRNLNDSDNKILYVKDYVKKYRWPINEYNILLDIIKTDGIKNEVKSY